MSIITDAIDHHEARNAECIHAIRQAAYGQEAAILGIRMLPPLAESASQIRESSDEFAGAWIDKRLAGVVSYSKGDSSKGCLITSLVVDPTCQRLGVGSALISAAVLKMGNKPISVSTAARNGPALALFAKFEFVEVGRRMVEPEKLELVDLLRK